MDEVVFKKQLGELLRRYRKQKLMTIEEVANKINIDDKHLGRIERGQYNISAYSLFKLIHVLEIHDDVFHLIKH
ncbi:helix-turn-helix domain-containing protein [Lentibacillus saliphilus]|uniref:helix-turn-helix domain-containing protein n=1 Tax=Lentibacillus saliphilus TaxID=2737028 RepID=UPI001C309962